MGFLNKIFLGVVLVLMLGVLVVGYYGFIPSAR
jgi:hypothetical protein